MNRREFIKGAAIAAAGGLLAKGISVSGSYAAPARASGGKKNVLVVTGSPRKNGNSNTLAEQFIRGARDAGHTVSRFDAGLSTVRGCTACNHCHMNGPCILDDDDFGSVRERIVAADAILFASPVYYYNISTQIKAVMDRFYAINGRIHVHKRAAFLLTLANSDMERVQPIIDFFRRGFFDYLGWEYAGHLVGTGLWPVGAVNGTRYMDEAYRLGRNI